MIDETRPRWLFVVRRDKRELHRHLRQSFASDPRVEVILDRRREDRNPVAVERRQAPVTTVELDLWESLGFRLILRGEDFTVYEDETRPSTGGAAP